jgi:hypothetical protein
MKKSMWEDGLLLEIKIARIIQEQEEVGVLFNKGKAVWLLRDLENKKEDLYKTIRPYLQYDLVIQETKLKDKEEYSYVKKLRNKDGSLTKSVINFINDIFT